MFLFDRGQFVDGIQNELAPKVGTTSISVSLLTCLVR
jgi:hypothetical protein